MSIPLRLAFLLILLSAGISIAWGIGLARLIPGGPIDFQAIYYGSRTLLQHHDPYIASEVERVYRSETGRTSSETARDSQRLTLFVNLPPTLLFVAPFALLPLSLAQTLWMFLTATILMTAAFLMWDLGAEYSPILSGVLIAFLLANCQFVFATGNTAGVVVGLCTIATWCFIRNRYVPAGILCMAASLAIKPHDAGLVWLYFLLDGGISAKRAVQSAALTGTLGASAVLWVSSVAPHWIRDWGANMAAIAAPGGLNDPRPDSVVVNSAGSNISLQAVFSLFRPDPHFYNTATYLVCGALLLVWAVTTQRWRSGRHSAWFALAAIAPLTVLVTYHRVYDAKLLLLTIPACALLWAEDGAMGKVAAALNSLAIILNADVTVTIFGRLTERLHLSATTAAERILAVVVARPNQAILLILGVFYLWAYVRQSNAPCISSRSRRIARQIDEFSPAQPAGLTGEK